QPRAGFARPQGGTLPLAQYSAVTTEAAGRRQSDRPRPGIAAGMGLIGTGQMTVDRVPSQDWRHCRLRPPAAAKRDLNDGYIARSGDVDRARLRSLSRVDPLP